MPNSRFILVPNLELDEIAAYHEDVDSALRLYFIRAISAHSNRFSGMSSDEVRDLLASRLEESDRRSSLMVLTSLEALFRVDFDARCRGRLKDQLSNHFRGVERRGGYISLDDDILKGWKLHTTASAKLISELRGSFKFRHWLAHGRYWTAKPGRKYDFVSVYLMAKSIVAGFPFES